MMVREQYDDPLIKQLFEIIEREAEQEPARQYVGASSIGDRCERKLWYQLMEPEKGEKRPASLILAANDGHRSEAVMAEYLRKIPGVQLWTNDAATQGKQYGFSDHGGMYKGHVDGIILGIPLAPKTPHIWEHKCCNQKKFEALQKLKSSESEKEVLKKWDYLYYCQAVTYMKYMDLTRHYTTVMLAGSRNLLTIRTDENKELANSLTEKARRILGYDTAPVGISTNPSWYECKFCRFTAHCHGKKDGTA